MIGEVCNGKVVRGEQLVGGRQYGFFDHRRFLADDITWVPGGAGKLDIDSRL